jgi:hypothetical protein
MSGISGSRRVQNAHAIALGAEALQQLDLPPPSRGRIEDDYNFMQIACNIPDHADRMHSISRRFKASKANKVNDHKS